MYIHASYLFLIEANSLQFLLRMIKIVFFQGKKGFFRHSQSMLLEFLLEDHTKPSKMLIKKKKNPYIDYSWIWR